jgi:hypothetical protein
MWSVGCLLAEFYQQRCTKKVCILAELYRQRSVTKFSHNFAVTEFYTKEVFVKASTT